MDKYATIEELKQLIVSLADIKQAAEISLSKIKDTRETLKTLFDTNIEDDEEFNKLLSEQNRLDLQIESQKNNVDTYNNQHKQILSNKHPSLKRLKIHEDEVVIFETKYFTIKKIYRQGPEKKYEKLDY